LDLRTPGAGFCGAGALSAHRWMWQFAPRISMDIRVSGSENLGNKGGYDRVLPARMPHDHFAIDTAQFLSYARLTLVHFLGRWRR
jgi:hypothetical protein